MDFPAILCFRLSTCLQRAQPQPQQQVIRTHTLLTPAVSTLCSPERQHRQYLEICSRCKFSDSTTDLRSMTPELHPAIQRLVSPPGDLDVCSNVRTTGGTLVARSVKCPSLGSGVGHELMVVRLSPPLPPPTLDSMLTGQSQLGILSLPLSLPLPTHLYAYARSCVLSLPLKINK